MDTNLSIYALLTRNFWMDVIMDAFQQYTYNLTTITQEISTNALIALFDQWITDFFKFICVSVTDNGNKNPQNCLYMHCIN